MKKFKKMMALVIAMVMVLAMALPAMAEVPVTTPTDGKITINSPIVGAKYNAYKVFDMTSNEAHDSFSYTISKSSPFYNAVKAYADVAANKLHLTATQADPNTFNVTVDDGFDAQAFGAALQDGINGKDGAVAVTGATAIPATYETGQNAVTVAKAEAVSFDNLAYGYYLILSEYPETVSTVTIKDAEGNEYGSVTKDSTAAEKTAIIDAYVAAQTTDAKIQAYIDEKGLKDTDEEGNEIAIVKDGEAWNKVKKQLQDSTKEDAELKIAQGLNQIAASEADDNTLTQRLVFVDSTTPSAVINEKNEVHKWDVPVNPTGQADLEGLPDHGEPEGGKNIIIKEETSTTPAVYADWTEANVGDSIHYQLSINATNFERTTTNPITVKQIKEYIIADYQNKNMTFDESKKLMVKIVKKDKDGNIVGDPLYSEDYTAWKDKFFKNTAGQDLASGASVLTANESTGLALSWIEEVTEEQAKTKDNVTTTTVDKMENGEYVYKKGKTPLSTDSEGHKIDADGHSVNDDGYLIDAQGQPIKETETHYWASKYPNDVTILVDYYMTLNDTAVVDGTGNINYSQYGVNYVEPTDKSYTPVSPTTTDDRKPSSVKDQDDATVYTYAIAIHKVDENKNDLDGAKFKALGLTVTQKAAGYYKVSKYDKTSEEYGTEMVTDSKGLLIIEGLSTSDMMTFMETQAPAGYNKLEGTVTGNATKLSETVTTTFTETYYDADGNVTDQKADAATTTTIVTTIDKLKAIAIEIINNKGNELPATGGMGTTLFYAIGAILVLGAGILLVTKRRMSAN